MIDSKGRFYECIASKRNTGGLYLCIPENSTNGDVIKTLFPDCIVDEDFNGAVITNIDEKQYWKKNWWNASYKRGETE